MSEMPELFGYVFIWQALGDACPKCQRLNGREYHNQDLFQSYLEDPFEGPIWDLENDQPLTHHNCRCHLECKAFVDLGDWEPLNELRRNLEQQY